MFLRQKLDEREWIKKKIKELKNSAYTFTKHQDEVLKQLLILMDKLQSINLILNKINNESIIDIAGTKLSMQAAVEIRSTMKAKIDVISELIALDNGKLDILALIIQRDSMVEEYAAIDSAINQADWKIQLEQ